MSFETGLGAPRIGTEACGDPGRLGTGPMDRGIRNGSRGVNGTCSGDYRGYSR